MWIKTENLIFKFPLPPDILSNVASVERPDKQAINEKKACLQICQVRFKKKFYTLRNLV